MGAPVVKVSLCMHVPYSDSMEHPASDVKPSRIYLPGSILRDRKLLRSAMCMGLLLALVAFGAESYPMEIPLGEIAEGWGKSYPAINKVLHRLESLGYVHLGRRKGGRRRLLIQVIWPEPKPKRRAKRNGKSSKAV